MNPIPDPELFLQTPLRGIWLVLAPSAIGTRLLMNLAARLALEGPLRVLDGGNRFNAYQCSRDLARYLTAHPAQADESQSGLALPGMDAQDAAAHGAAAQGAGRPHTWKQALERISLARAFTCYQMLTLLGETPPLLQRPTLALDLLATFYDESVRADEALHLLERCLGDLRRLSAQAPVVVSARPPRPGRGFTYGFTPESARPELMEALKDAADEMVTWEEPGQSHVQLRFF